MQLANVTHQQREGSVGEIEDGSQSSPSPNYCPRGLEHLLSAKHSRSLQAERDALYDALLVEQHQQWEANSGDSVTGSSVVDYEDYNVSSERLADISRRHSSEAVQRALRLAQADADFAASYNPPPNIEAPATTINSVLATALSMSDLLTLKPEPASSTAQASSTSSSRSWPLPTSATRQYHREGGVLRLPHRSSSDIASSFHDRGNASKQNHLPYSCSPLRRNCISLLDLKTLNTSQQATSTTAAFGSAAMPSSLALGGGSLSSSLTALTAIECPVEGGDHYLLF